MPKIQSLVIIDNDQSRATHLKNILEFLGAKCILLDGQSWKKQFPTVNEVRGIICGDLDIALEGVDAKLPIAVLDSSDNANDKSYLKSVQGQIVGEISWPVQQNEILEILYGFHVCRNGSASAVSIRKSQALSSKMVGQSKIMAETRRLIEQVAKSDASVLVLGESGTGKEVAARGLHDMSDRSAAPFVPINCGAIPAELLESELFGHEKGAFTGALTTRKGRFELAEGGTIFLDEIGDMPMPMQVKLLRVLQEKTFERIGSGKPIMSNVRIIAATHRNLSEEVSEGRFREDLFYRLNVFPIEMPSLRDRAEDIGQLATELVSRLEKDKRGSVRLSPNAVQSLMQCQWPGNVRELANLMERLCILHPYGVVDLKELPQDYRNESGLVSYEKPDLAESALLEMSKQQETVISENSTDTSDLLKLPKEGVHLKDFIQEIEVSYIEQALMQEDWVVARAAKLLSMQRTTLVEKMRKYKLQK